MRLFAILGLLTASSCFAQQPAPSPEPGPPVSADNQTLTIPAGTRITLALTNPIRTKLARPGDTVRVTTAFPVVVGSQLAIPVGTYMEGLLDKVIKRGPNGHPALQMHFTRIIFSNGYTVPLDGATAEAKVVTPSAPLPQSSSASTSSPPSSSPKPQGIPANSFAGQQAPPPTLPPPPQVGPGKGVFIGLAAAGAAASIVGAILMGRHRINSDYQFEAGWQFDLILGNPVSLDSTRVAAAIAAAQ